MVTRLWEIQRGQMWSLEAHRKDYLEVKARIPVKYSEIGRGELDEVITAMGSSTEEAVRQRFKTGTRCFGGWVDGRLGVYGWASHGVEWIGELGREFRIPREDVYVWDCATLPDYRRNRLYSGLLSFMTNRLHLGGARRIWIGSDRNNQPSIGGFRNAGFQPAVEVTSLTILSLQSLKVKSLSKPGSDLEELFIHALRIDGEKRIGSWLVGGR